MTRSLTPGQPIPWRTSDLIRPRWRKVIRDLWDSKSRTVLVVLSIAVGVFAVGTLSATQTILTHDLAAGYAATNPASATITTKSNGTASTGLFDQELVDSGDTGFSYPYPGCLLHRTLP